VYVRKHGKYRSISGDRIVNVAATTCSVCWLC